MANLKRKVEVVFACFGVAIILQIILLFILAFIFDMDKASSIIFYYPYSTIVVIVLMALLYPVMNKYLKPGGD